MTNEEKYIIVTKALYSIEISKHIFICNAIESAAGNTLKIFKIIPELLEYKPSNKDKSSPWWLGNYEGKQERIRVLKDLQLRFKNIENENSSNK